MKTELLQAVFSAVDPHENQKLCVVKYVRLEGNISRGRAVEILRDRVSQRYRDVKFHFWCDSWAAGGPVPERISEEAS